MPASTVVLDQDRDSIGIWVAMTSLSILCHIILFTGVLFLPKFRHSKSLIPSSVEVDLVSLPGPPPGRRSGRNLTPASQPEAAESSVHEVRPAGEPLPAKKAQVPKAAEKAPKIEEKAPKAAESKPLEAPVPLSPGPVKVKQSLKKESYDASRAIRGAIARIEKEADQSRPSPVLEAIGRLKKETLDDTQGLPGNGGDHGEGGAGEGGSKKGVDLLDIYNAEIWDRIRKNWAFSAELAEGRDDWEAIIIVKIMRQGEVRDVWFEKRSGNAYYDSTVMAAVKKSDPLPPLPLGYLGPFYEVGFRFNPTQLRNGPQEDGTPD